MLMISFVVVRTVRLLDSVTACWRRSSLIVSLLVLVRMKREVESYFGKND